MFPFLLILNEVCLNTYSNFFSFCSFLGPCIGFRRSLDSLNLNFTVKALNQAIFDKSVS